MNIRSHLLRASSPVGTSSTSSDFFLRTTARRAFSLIEIMVGVSLISVIIVGLLAMFYQVQRAFRAGTAQADIMEGGRATMNLIVRDLQEMTACQLILNPPFQVTNFAVVPAIGADWRYQDLVSGNWRPNMLQEICFLSRNGDVWTGTSYRLSNAVSGVGTLYRVVTNRIAQTLYEDQSNLLKHVSRVVCETTYPNPAEPIYHRVVDGVVNLTVTPCDALGVPYTTYSDTTNNDPRLRFDSSAGVTGVYAFMANALPAYLDIELAVLEPATLIRFNAQWEIDEPTGIPTRATNYLARHIGQTHIFRQRVAIRPSSTEISSR